MKKNNIRNNVAEITIKDKFFSIIFEIIVFSLFLIYLIILRLIIPIFNENCEFFNESADWFYYINMAEDITSIFRGEIRSPFCYRPLMPFIAALLPLDLQTNFAIVSFISIYLTGIMVYFTLKIDFNKLMSLVGLILFCYLSYLGMKCPYWDCFFHMDFYNVYLVDSLAFLFLMCCFYTILTSNKRLFSIFLIFGTLTKEIVLFTIPVFLIYNFIEENKKENKKEFLYDFFKSSFYILPALAVFITFRLIVREFNIFSLIMDLRGFTGLRITQFFEGYDIYYYSFGIWGLLIVFCLLNKIKDIIKWIKLYGIFMILIYCQILVALSVARLIYAGFFPLIYLAVLGIVRMQHFIQSLFKLNNAHDK